MGRNDGLKAVVLLICTVPGVVLVAMTLANHVGTLSMAQARTILAYPEESFLLGPEPTPFGPNIVPYLAPLAIAGVGSMMVAAWTLYAHRDRFGLLVSVTALIVMFVLLSGVSAEAGTRFSCAVQTPKGCQTIRFFVGGSALARAALFQAIATCATFVTFAAFLFRLGEGTGR